MKGHRLRLPAFLTVWCLLQLAAGATLLAAGLSDRRLMALGIATLVVVKATLIVRGFMGLQRENPAFARGLIIYACLLGLFAGARMVATDAKPLAERPVVTAVGSRQ